jgi:glycosyltransferase involved in cell wall biosynthesis
MLDRLIRCYKLAVSSLFETPAPDRRPQLLVDVSVIYKSDARTGIQRVVRAVWAKLEQERHPTHDLIPVVATRRRSYRVAPADFLHRSVRPALTELARVSQRIPGDIFFGLDLGAHILPVRANQLLNWRRQGCRLTVMMFDLLPVHHPEWFSEKLSINFRRWLDFVGRNADDVICISHSVASAFHAWMAGVGRPDPPPSLHIVRLGSDLDASVPSSGLTAHEARVLDQWKGRTFFLSVGTIEPRKGHSVLLDAMEVAWQREPELRLIIVGQPGWHTETLQQRMTALAAGNSRFLWFANSSDEMLARLYEQCSGVVAASLDEGFGLPIQEALSHGCPVLARDIPVFRELASPGLNYFSSDQPAAFANDLLKFLARNPRPISREPAGPQHRWEDCAREILALLGLGEQERQVEEVT